MQVYNPELLGAVYSSVPEQAQKQFVHNDEGAQVKEVMHNLEKEQHDKITRRIAKRQHEVAEKEKAEAYLQEKYKREVEKVAWNEFKKRNDAFFIRHVNMFEATLPIIQRSMWNDACARREVYNKWHEEVYKPIQYQIDKAVEHKCNSTNRPHIYQTIKDKWNVPHYCCTTNNNTNSNGGEEEWNEKLTDEIHAIQDREFYFTNTMDSNIDKNKLGEEGQNVHSAKLHLENADFANTKDYMMQSSAAPLSNATTYNNNNIMKTIKPEKLTWKEQKDELWQSFLRESNRKSYYGGRHGIFLDVIDEVSYDPLRQCHEDTIYYNVPLEHGRINNNNSCNALCSNDKKKEKIRRRAIADVYNKLALAYRTEEDKSITEVLKHTYHVPSSISEVRINTANTQTTNDQNTQSKTQRSRLPSPVYVENEYVHLPHVFIPFDYGAYQEISNTDESIKTEGKNNEHHNLEQEEIKETNNYNRNNNNTNKYNRGNFSNGMTNEQIDEERKSTKNKCKEQITKPIMPLNTFSNPHSYHSAAADTSMPPNMSLLPHVSPSTTIHSRKDNKDLKVCQWGKRELANTRYGRYVSTNGDVLPLCERRKEYALQASKSNVHFDHFNYPRGNDNEQFVFTGKRMYIL